MTYNIEFGYKISDIERWLQSLPKKNDLLCFQEFPKSRIPSVMQVFPDYSFQYSGGMERKGETFGQLTVFKKKLLNCVSSTSLFLGDSRVENIMMRTKSIKNALITVFEMHGLKFIVANIHLSCLTLNSRRRRQLMQLIEEINKIAAEVQIPVIIMGDYNYTSLFMQEFLFQFMQKYNFTNAFRETTHRLGFLKQQLDYVFCRNCRVSNYEVIKNYFSDHFPIQFVYSI